MSEVKRRDDIPEEYKWRIEDIFGSDVEWERAYEGACSIPEELAAYAGRLSDGTALLEFLRKNDEADITLSALYRDASMKSDEDTTVGKYTEMEGRAYDLYVRVGAACAFATPEIMAIPEEQVERLYDAEPGLSLYRLAIDRILVRRPHVLSENEERLLAMASQMGKAPGDISSKLSDADMTFPDVDTPEGPKALTQGSYAVYRTHTDREVRRDAFVKLHEAYNSMGNTFAATLDSQMKQLKFFADARRYPSTLEAALSSNEVPTAVYTNLIDTVRANMDKMHGYIALRKKLLGLEELHMYDLYVPIVGDAAVTVPYEVAVENCMEAVRPLGEAYCAVMREGFDNRWVDVYESKGKRSGAYSSGARPHPFVLLNYADTLDSEFTLIHEMGHSLHSYLSKEGQPTVYSDYVIFVAEVASTCNEVLLMKHLLSRTEDKRQRAYLINYFLEQFRTTVY
ncbi:MAG: oligoendopeptidase F family protein, partial [Clostridia bacterium]|nr:oligoendopeptidase F family protein [Clostridia bacterium]